MVGADIEWDEMGQKEFFFWFFAPFLRATVGADFALYHPRGPILKVNIRTDREGG